MWVSRYQFPVGQGCFHAGTIGAHTGTGEVHYIYDCGSQQQRPLQSAIDLHKAKTSLVQALFVSHLDSDHVSGLDRLLAGVEVDTVYLPHLHLTVLLLDLVEADLNGALSASLIEASISPQSWFGRRGVRRVVRIRGLTSPPQDSPPDSNEDDSPEGPAEDEQGRLEGSPSEVRGDLSLVERPLPRQVRPAKAGERAALLEAEARFEVMIQARPHDLQDSHDLHWLLQPHVDPAPKERRHAFLRAVRTALGLQSRQRLTFRRISAALRDLRGRNSLRACYDEIIAGGARRNHNRVSMSLYSGPRNGESEWDYSARAYPLDAWFDAEEYWGQFGRSANLFQRKAVGWLGTGDAALNRKEVRTRWQEAYEPVRDDISTLLLPHHGSRHNFSCELLQFPNLELCVASGRHPSRYGHPSGEVVSTIQRSGRTLCHVTQSEYSGLAEEMILV